jgi:GlcNAc-P-P-Und epimerase
MTAEAGRVTVDETRVGVIGGGGFIGTWLVEALRGQGHKVQIIDLESSGRFPDLVVWTDVCDRAALLEACRGCDVVYNLAAEHHDNVRPCERYHQVNVQGALNTCSVAEELGIERIIFTSSVAVYGMPEGEANEDAPCRPFNEYGRTKLEAEAAFLRWAERSPRRSLSIVRPSVVFGPGNRGNVYILLQQAASGRAVMIGKGANRKSMAYVGNVADFLVHALGFGPGVHVCNYVDKPDLDMRGLLALVQQALGTSGSLRIPYAVGLMAGIGFDLAAQLTGCQFSISAVRVRKYAASTQFAAERALSTGFRPARTLQAALIDTIRHEFTPHRHVPTRPGSRTRRPSPASPASSRAALARASWPERPETEATGKSATSATPPVGYPSGQQENRLG